MGWDVSCESFRERQLVRSTPPRLHTIAHILPWPAVGGTEHATLRIAKAIDPSRFTSIAFYLSGAESVRTLFAEAGIRASPYIPAVPSYRHGARFVAESLSLSRQLRRHGVDLVHCADLPAAHAAALAAWFAGIPVICHVRNRFDRVSRRDCSFLWPVRKFVFVSQDTWRRFSCKVSPSRGTVVYDGIDLPAARDARHDRDAVCREFGIPCDAPIIGMVARVAPQKDFETLVRAAAAVLAVEPRARFLLAGDHTSDQIYQQTYQRVRRVIEECGVGHAFVFTGHRPDVSHLLEALDIFVLSTHWEGLPLVILEAMAHQKPVVATAVDGIPEIVKHGESGLLFPHEDHRALADHLVGLLKDRPAASRLAEAGRRFVQRRFSREQFGSNMTSLYSGVLNRVGVGRAPEEASAT
jgi:glycosyltransferase involved in cell wall biosynthesis